MPNMLRTNSTNYLYYFYLFFPHIYQDKIAERQVFHENLLSSLYRNVSTWCFNIANVKESCDRQI
jgi:hypothetical protein